MAQPLVFNSGAVYTIDGDTVPTPVQVGTLQSASIDLKATTKKLYGQNILPVASGRSQIEVSGKFTFAGYDGRLIRDFFGSSMTAGQILIVQNEAGTVPASSVYTISVANHTTFTTDLGVVYASSGLPLEAVASGSEAAGKYSYAAGVYTFSSADASAAVRISYLYTSDTNGDTITISNASAGAASTFKTVMGMGYQGSQLNFTLNACIPGSLKLLDSKLGDFSMPEYDFDAITDSSDTLGTISVSQIS